MRKHAKNAVSTALCLWLIAAGGRLSGDEVTPVRWGGARTPNMISDAKNLPADLANAEPLWELPLGTHQYTIPTIDGDRIFVGANDLGHDRPGVRATGGGVLMCVERATGRLIWRLLSPRYFEGIQPPYHFNQWKSGFCSGPVVDGDRVFVVGGRGEILCVDRDGQADGNDGPFLDELEYMGAENQSEAALGPTDGDIIWSYNLLTDLGVIPHDVCGSTLLLLGDLLYACTSNGLDDRHDKIPSPSAPALIVLDKRTGRLVARESEGISARTLHCNWSSPSAGTVNGRTIVFFGGGDGFLYAFEPPRPTADGGVLNLVKIWSRDCNPPEYRERDGQPVPYSKHNRRRSDGPSEIIGTPVFHDGRVYVTIGQSPLHGVGQGHLCCVDAATGETIWGSTLVDRSLATVSIADGLLYVADFSGKLHCFDAITGQRYWDHELGAGAWCASTFVADGKVYASTEKKTLWVLAAGRDRKVLSETRMRTIPITPTAADGVLLVPMQTKLVAFRGP